MARALVLAAALLLLATPPASALDEPTGDLVAGSEETVLRLHDLPAGYQVGSDSDCGPLSPGGEEGDPAGRLERRYLRWVFENWPEGCFYEYERAFEVPGALPSPPLVEVETINTAREEVAVRGHELYSALLNRFTKKRDRKTVTIAPFGVQALLIRSRDALVEGRKGQAGSFLIWRHGKLIALLQVAGLKPPQNDRAALRLAEIQQARLEQPSPYAEVEKDDAEVPLDDPGLKLPVYWIGNPFQPGAGLPAATLEDTAVVTGPGEAPPGQKIQLEYDSFWLATWTRASWKRFRGSVLGPLSLKARCARRTEVELDRGRAVVYAGYGRARLRTCPNRAPDRHWAIAYVGGVVVGVNLAHCTGCLETDRGPYDSLRGMETVLRGLVLRPKPVY
jgi:hypothetical protein